ncbi:hypothetical protein Dsin_002613 [Dipteronia sinensis]|uniref:Reverse transcriptase domain-containing protein n=1 Tax=Dipteronia sinensis TaxID=43782 RepID=A0AAE0B6G2_9ROSI|nr:hypothetical protein Dsin_002613 [Dipteronia sinensis]
MNSMRERKRVQKVDTVHELTNENDQGSGINSPINKRKAWKYGNSSWKSVIISSPLGGLRQGVPLPPYLFLIYDEGFSSRIRRAQYMGDIAGFKCGKRGPIISHLFFADDSLLFAKANDSNRVAVKRVLEDYTKALGQVVNFNRSTMCVSHSMLVTEDERLAAIVGVNLVSCHERYLSLPYFTGRSKRKLFSEIANRVWGKIKGWGERLLSVGGIEILIKAVIQSVLTYTMSLFRLLKGLISKIHPLCARFWWGSNGDKRKIHWCTWSRLCKSKMKWGLGFRDLKTFNKALLSKQCRRIFKNPESLVARILKKCYFLNDNLLEASKKSSTYNSMIWGKGLMEAGLRWRVGRSTSINIYNDKGVLNPSTFKIFFPLNLGGDATVD